MAGESNFLKSANLTITCAHPIPNVYNTSSDIAGVEPTAQVENRGDINSQLNQVKKLGLATGDKRPMGKSRAEIQRDYRERKKRKDPNFLEKERKRQVAYRIPASDLTGKKLEARRRNSRVYSNVYRSNKKTLVNAQDSVYRVPAVPTVTDGSQDLVQSDVVSSSTAGSQQTVTKSTDSTPLLVKFQFPSRRSTSTERSEAKESRTREIDLIEKNVLLERTIRKIHKRKERTTHPVGENKREENT